MIVQGPVSHSRVGLETRGRGTQVVVELGERRGDLPAWPEASRAVRGMSLGEAKLALEMKVGLGFASELAVQRMILKRSGSEAQPDQ